MFAKIERGDFIGNT
ncbi:hypothetical protein A2U01_0092305, partial [Trifolium medium]|nr:hypothetical protein [Trifolium medium]